MPWNIFLRWFITQAKVFNACGPFVLENILCIGENRAPNYDTLDAPNLTRRIVSNLKPVFLVATVGGT